VQPLYSPEFSCLERKVSVLRYNKDGEIIKVFHTKKNKLRLSENVILKKQNVRVWTRFIWLCIGSNDRPL